MRNLYASNGVLYCTTSLVGWSIGYDKMVTRV